MSAISVVNLSAQRHLALYHLDQSLHHRQRRIPLSPVVDEYIGVSAIALHYMAYNFVRIHKTLRGTSAMAAGVTDHVWELEEIVVVLEVREVASFKAT
jgi:hypothetical protein